MIPNNKKELKKYIFLETARAAYPGGMSMYGKGIVSAGNKKVVSNFFISKDFFLPKVSTFDKDHKELCRLLSERININTNRNRLNKLTVSAKFLDTFLYQLMKFEDYRNLWGKLHLIVDVRLLKALHKCADDHLVNFLRSYPQSPYEATYQQYLNLQHELAKFIKRIPNTPIKHRIELNFLWAGILEAEI